uniref:NADH-ubiquinone oxidoreductase chain 2 n=2 Tax=Syrista parreyssii TaxID=1090889 RepID=A0A8K1WK54_9HYME|nr:NADH dehydrogenase subunit 2 [Syrista parreyssii]
MMLIYYIMMITSTMIAMTATSWLSMWMMLEINLMSFVPILFFGSNKKTNFLFKYFIVQNISSATFLTSIILLWTSELMNINNLINFNMFNFIMTLSMIMKMGLVPMHMWYIEVLMYISWMNIFLMSTWQKIIPLMIISYMHNNMTMNISIMLSCLLSSIQGMSQLNLRKIMAFSSMNHSSWMMINSTMSLYLMFIYMIIYSMISYNIIYMFNINNVSYLHEIYFMNNYNSTYKLFLFYNILSMAGLPPFLGFMIKLMSIKFLILNNMFLITSMLMISSLLSLIFYLRMMYSSLILISSKSKIKLLNFNMFNYLNKNLMLNLNKLMFMFSMMNFITMINLIIFNFY